MFLLSLCSVVLWPACSLFPSIVSDTSCSSNLCWVHCMLFATLNFLPLSGNKPGFRFPLTVPCSTWDTMLIEARPEFVPFASPELILGKHEERKGKFPLNRHKDITLSNLRDNTQSQLTLGWTWGARLLVLHFNVMTNSLDFGSWFSDLYIKFTKKLKKEKSWCSHHALKRFRFLYSQIQPRHLGFYNLPHDSSLKPRLTSTSFGLGLDSSLAWVLMYLQTFWQFLNLNELQSLLCWLCIEDLKR